MAPWLADALQLARSNYFPVSSCDEALKTVALLSERDPKHICALSKKLQVSTGRYASDIRLLYRDIPSHARVPVHFMFNVERLKVIATVNNVMHVLIKNAIIG